LHEFFLNYFTPLKIRERPAAQQRPKRHASHAANANETGVHCRINYMTGTPSCRELGNPIDVALSGTLAIVLSLVTLRPVRQLVVPAVRKALLEHTQGITVRIVRAIENLATDAIRSGRECIDQQGLSGLASFPPLFSMEDRSSALV
jgi:hypothetical protein